LAFPCGQSEISNDHIEQGADIAVDASGAIYAAGGTVMTMLPRLAAAQEQSRSGEDDRALSRTASALVFVLIPDGESMMARPMAICGREISRSRSTA
jgi:hypothetical protein